MITFRLAEKHAVGYNNLKSTSVCHKSRNLERTSLPRSRFLGCHATLHPKEATADIRTAFLSLYWPIIGRVPFLGTLSRQTRIVQSETVFNIMALVFLLAKAKQGRILDLLSDINTAKTFERCPCRRDTQQLTRFQENRNCSLV